MKFNSTSKNPNKNLESKKVKYNQTTGLFSNPDRTIAFQSYEDANRYNNSLDETPGETPMQDALKNIRKPLKDGSTGVKYKNAFERNEEVRKERLNKAWGINQHPAEKYYDNKMKEIDKKGTSYLAKHLNKTNPVLENRGRQTLAINHTANKVLNNQVKKGNIKKEDLMLQPDRNGLLTNKSKTIAMRDSFMAKQFNNALGVNEYQPEATPEQVGALAERLERSRQMTGGKATNLKDLENRYKQPDKPIIKKKKISTPIEPVKIDYKPFIPIQRPEQDPEMIARERRFNQMQDEMNREKWKRNNTGVAGLMGGVPKYYGK